MVVVVLVIAAVIVGGVLAGIYVWSQFLDATSDYRSIKATRLAKKATEQLKERTAQIQQERRPE